ncbi:MAG: tRNA 4-thiouridine(8) synthase ThiI [Deltaproteobacteria bacterium]|nr:tRNA 4-thiouridine(8) synthase ThiI [Deltaproteobacteria bacterium]
MKNIFLIRYSSELALKGKNRKDFETLLVQNIKDKFPKRTIQFKKEHRRLFLETDLDQETVKEKLLNFIGIASFSPVTLAPLVLEDIIETALCLVKPHLKTADRTSFRVETKRPNKNFPLSSPDMNGILGAALHKQFPEMMVDFDNPDITLGVEIRDDAAHLYLEKIQGGGGLPTGSSGKMVSLLSGGIDSPVASWFMMRRGAEVVFATYHSPPFLEEEAYNKILSLAKKLSEFQTRTKVYQVYFTDVQKAIKLNVHDRYRTLMYRRFMHRIASRIAEKEQAQALITGEALGQVASQTLENLICIGSATNYLVMRPLIGFDKEEIIKTARKIGTYDISIQPYGDCCTLFAPQNPATKGRLEDILEIEKSLNVEELILNALEKTKIITF